MSLQTVWVEMPVKDLDRAVKFYEGLLGAKFETNQDDVRRISVIANQDEKNTVGVSLTQTKDFTPSRDGVLVYFMAWDNVEKLLKQVEDLGGKMVIPKTDMGGGFGFFSTFEDTEGNVLAFYSAE
jgi:uncharacterized protein